MKWGWLVAAAVASCGSDPESPRAKVVEQPARSAGAPASTRVLDAAVPLLDAAVLDVAPVVALPDAVGMPVPLDQLRPYMKEDDARRIFSSLPEAVSVPNMLFIPDRGTIYALQRDVFVVGRFHEGRLHGVELYAMPDTVLSAPARAKWGSGVPHTSSLRHFYKSFVEWPTTTGWTAELRIGPHDDYVSSRPPYAELMFEASYGAGGGEDPWLREPEVTAPSMRALADLLGQPLAAGSKLLGSQMELEAEGAAEAETYHGYAHVKFEWADTDWSIELGTDRKTQRIGRIVLAGEADGNEEQRALVKELEAAFGARRAIIDDVGDLWIGFGAGGRIDARAFKGVSKWRVELRRR